MEVPRPHPHLACYTFDLPAVTLIGRENTARQSLSFVTIQKKGCRPILPATLSL